MDEQLQPFSDAGKAAANDLSKRVIGAAIEVHRVLGPGLLEAAYEECLCRELDLLGIPFARQLYLDIEYKGIIVKNAYRVDVFVAGLVVVDLKSIAKFESIHEAQLLTYLRLANRWLGLLLNFNVPVLKDGIMRRVRG
jgi:GxxExxY protein